MSGEAGDTLPGRVSPSRNADDAVRQRASTPRESEVDVRVAASASGDGVVLETPGGRVALSRADARALRSDLADALTARREFLHTAGEHREDGSYVVERRGADSSGHRKVFESFASLRRLYDRQPATFTAEDVGGAGLTGGRRHMVVRHLAEHPAFDCGLASRQPLTVAKADCTSGDPSGRSSTEVAGGDD